MASQEPGNKALSAFELETRIRVIIKELLDATSNKQAVFNYRLIQFSTRIDGFEKHFFSFNDRVVKLQEISGGFQTQSNIIKDRMSSLTDTFHSVSDKTQEESQKARFMMSDQVTQFKQIEAKLKAAAVMNQKILSQNAKTKNKFAETTDLINDVKLEIQQKINKFVQTNINLNVEIKGMFSSLNNDVFRTNTTVESQNKRFQEGMMKLDEQLVFGKDMKERFMEMQQNLTQKVDVKQLQKHFFDVKSQLQIANQKFQEKIIANIENMIQKNTILKQLKQQFTQVKSQLNIHEEEIERMEKNLLGRFIDFENKLTNFSDQAERNASKQLQAVEKMFESKLETFKTQTNVMRKQFAGSIKHLKGQLQSLLAEKTQQIISKQKVSQQEKQMVSQEMVQQLKLQKQEQQQNFNQRLQMLQGRFTNMMREQMSKIMDQVKVGENHSDNSMINKEMIDNLTKQLSEEFQSKLNLKTQELMTRIVSNQNKLDSFSQITKDQIRQISTDVQIVSEQFAKLKNQVSQESNQNSILFMNLKTETEQRLQKLSFMVTKIRGDVTLKTDFVSKEIKDVMKKLTTEAEKLDGLLRLSPAISESVNLLLALAFDMEVNTKSNTSHKFMTMMEGILYQFKGRSDLIHYRHKSVPKIDLIKATFMGCTDIWESLLQGSFRGMSDYFPKSFFFQCVDKRLQTLLLEGQNNFKNTKSPLLQTKTFIKQQRLDSMEHISQETLNQTEGKDKKPSQFNVRKQKSLDKSKLLTEESSFGIFESPTRRNSKQFTQIQFK